jgi:pimeloyl-ACP methyl ester carboxylesterase
MTLIADAAHPASRALSPHESGYADSGGVRIGYEVFGQGEETLLLLPPWSIVHSRFWKAQVPYLARHFRVITYDPRGSGRSDRPDTPAGYGPHKDAADAIAVLDATGTPRCVFVAHCAIAGGALLLATEHPERVAGAVFMTPALPISPPRPERTGNDFEAVLPHYEGWAKSNRHYWQQDFRGYLEFFFGRGVPEPHSTKQIEDAIGWGLEGSPDTLALTIEAPDMDEPTARELMGRIRCPILVT